MAKAAQLMKRSLLASLMCITMGCFCTSRNEVARLRSPDGEIDGIIVETNAGATTSYGYEVLLAPAGQPMSSGLQAARLYGAARSTSAYGVNLRWIGPSSLGIEYLNAKFVELEQAQLTSGGRWFTVVLMDGITDPTAPPGGMLYNLGPPSK
jgi:hypothetical protein